jgi:hypothetical protein
VGAVSLSQQARQDTIFFLMYSGQSVCLLISSLLLSRHYSSSLALTLRARTQLLDLPIPYPLTTMSVALPHQMRIEKNRASAARSRAKTVALHALLVADVEDAHAQCLTLCDALGAHWGVTLALSVPSPDSCELPHCSFQSPSPSIFSSSSTASSSPAYSYSSSSCCSLSLSPREDVSCLLTDDYFNDDVEPALF